MSKKLKADNTKIHAASMWAKLGRTIANADVMELCAEKDRDATEYVVDIRAHMIFKALKKNYLLLIENDCDAELVIPWALSMTGIAMDLVNKVLPPPQRKTLWMSKVSSNLSFAHVDAPPPEWVRDPIMAKHVFEAIIKGKKKKGDKPWLHSGIFSSTQKESPKD